MTDAEELEMLELEAEAAKHQQNAQAGADMADKEGHIGAFADKGFNTLTAGYGSNIEAGARAALPPLGEAALMGPMVELGKLLTPQGRDELRAKYPDKSYTQIRDELDARLNAQGDKFPKSSIAGNVAGFVAGAKGINKLLPAAKTAQGLSTAEKVWAAMKAGGKFGLVAGAAQNPGNVEGEITPVQGDKRLVNSAISGGLGVLLAPAAMAAGYGLNKVSDKLGDMAGRVGFRALGRLKPRDAQVLSELEQARLGRKAIDEGVIGNVPRGNSVIGERITDKLGQAGGRLDSAIDAVAETADALKREGMDLGTDKQAVAAELRRRLIDTSEAGSTAANKAYEAAINDFLELGAGPNSKMGIKATQDAASASGKKVDWTKLKREGYASLSPEQQAYLEKYGVLRDAVTDSAEGVAKFANQPEQASAIKAAKGDYADYKLMDKANSRELGLKNARNQIGLTQRMAFLAQMAKNNPVGALAHAALVHVADDLGPQIAAKQGMNMSRAIGAAGEGMSNQLIPALSDQSIYEWLKKQRASSDEKNN